MRPIVMAVGVGITVAARAVFGAVVNPSSAYETAGGTIGTLVSAGFLYLIALLNLIVLAGIFKVFRDMRRAPTTRPSSRPSCRRAG